LPETPSEPAGGAGQAPEEPQPGRGGRKRLLRRLSLLFAALALLFGLLAVAAQLRENASTAGFHYPSRLPDGATVVDAASGQQVVEAVKRLHWEPSEIKVENAAMIHYSDGTILWLTAADNACTMVEEMAGKIAAETRRLPYTEPVSLTVDGVRVYLVADKRSGAIHAFWCRGRLAAWAQLGVAPSNHSLLAETVKTLVNRVAYSP